MKMKLGNFLKIAFILCGITLLASSCTEDKYYTDPSIQTKWNIFKLTVNESGKESWKWDDNRKLYYCELDVPSLSEKIAIDGAVLISRDFGDNIFKPLANTEYYYQAPTGDNKGYYYSETVSFDYSPGIIVFYVQASDLFGNTEWTYVPPIMDFKVTFIY